jgi:hypothetical protein
MITINSNEEAQALIKDGVLAVDDDIEIAFDEFKIQADIKCKNIYSICNLNALEISALDINVSSINAWEIKAKNIKAWDIKVFRNINAKNIEARNINAGNIKAYDINYYAICCAYENICCTSIKGRRQNAKHFCLDGQITIKQLENDNEHN